MQPRLRRGVGHWFRASGRRHQVDGEGRRHEEQLPGLRRRAGLHPRQMLCILLPRRHPQQLAEVRLLVRWVQLAPHGLLLQITALGLCPSMRSATRTKNPSWRPSWESQQSLLSIALRRTCPGKHPVCLGLALCHQRSPQYFRPSRRIRCHHPGQGSSLPHRPRRTALKLMQYQESPADQRRFYPRWTTLMTTTKSKMKMTRKTR